jgi:hypothetical protein
MVFLWMNTITINMVYWQVLTMFLALLNQIMIHHGMSKLNNGQHLLFPE